MRFLSALITLLGVASAEVLISCKAGGDVCSNSTASGMSCCPPLYCGADSTCHKPGNPFNPRFAQVPRH